MTNTTNSGKVSVTSTEEIKMSKIEELTIKLTGVRDELITLTAEYDALDSSSDEAKALKKKMTNVKKKISRAEKSLEKEASSTSSSVEKSESQAEAASVGGPESEVVSDSETVSDDSCKKVDVGEVFNLLEERFSGRGYVSSLGAMMRFYMKYVKMLQEDHSRMGIKKVLDTLNSSEADAPDERSFVYSDLIICLKNSVTMSQDQIDEIEKKTNQTVVERTNLTRQKRKIEGLHESYETVTKALISDFAGKSLDEGNLFTSFTERVDELQKFKKSPAFPIVKIGNMLKRDFEKCDGSISDDTAIFAWKAIQKKINKVPAGADSTALKSVNSKNWQYVSRFQAQMLNYFGLYIKGFDGNVFSGDMNAILLDSIHNPAHRLNKSLEKLQFTGKEFVLKDWQYITTEGIPKFSSAVEFTGLESLCYDMDSIPAELDGLAEIMEVDLETFKSEKLVNTVVTVKDELNKEIDKITLSKQSRRVKVSNLKNSILKNDREGKSKMNGMTLEKATSENTKLQKKIDSLESEIQEIGKKTKPIIKLKKKAESIIIGFGSINGDDVSDLLK